MNITCDKSHNYINSITANKIAIVSLIAFSALTAIGAAIFFAPALIPATITLASLAVLSYPAYRLATVLIDSYKAPSQLDSRPELKEPQDIDAPKNLLKPIPADILQQIKPPTLDQKILEKTEKLRAFTSKSFETVKNSDDQEAIANLYDALKKLLDYIIVEFKLDSISIKLVISEIKLIPLLELFSEKLVNHPLKKEIDTLIGALTKVKKDTLPVASTGFVKTLTDRITNLTSYNDPKACRIKTSKYEALFKCIKILKSGWTELLFKENILEMPEAAALINEITSSLNKVNIELSSLENLNEVRLEWENMIPKLRELAALSLDKSSSLNPDLRKLVYKTCHALYFETDLHQENTELTKAVLNNREPSKVSLKDIFSAYEMAPPSLTTHSIDRALKSFNDVLGNHFCPLNSGNPPQKMFEAGNIRVIGMGCPTYQLGYEIGKGQPAATVDPIFLASLQHLEEPHLYISNQDHTSSERVRNASVMSIENRNFFAVTINKNNKLYEGEGPENANEYKYMLVRQFSLPIEESGCHIPKTIWPSVPRNAILREIANNIHIKIFGGSETLSKQDKRLFISLFNALVILKIMKDLGIKSINFTCKDGIDRGINSLAFFISLFLLASDKYDDPKTTEILAEILFTRAYWTRKREIKGDRFQRYQEDIQYLKSKLLHFKKGFLELLCNYLTDDQKENLKSFNVNFGSKPKV